MIKTTFETLVSHLQNDLHLEPESLVWLHSGVIGMGILEGGIATITNAFEKVLNNGALVIPSFTYSWCNGELYNRENSECPNVGAYAEKAWKDKRFIRNDNPNFSIAVMDNTDDGIVKNEICDVSTSSTCFGKGSVFEKMWQISLDRPSYILLLGGAHNDVVFRTTFLHMIEEKVGVPYRYIKYFFNPQNDNEKVSQYVRYLSKKEYHMHNIGLPEDDFVFPIKEKYKNLGDDLIKNNLIKQYDFGYSKSRVVKINHFCNWLEKKINNNPRYLLD